MQFSVSFFLASDSEITNLISLPLTRENIISELNSFDESQKNHFTQIFDAGVSGSWPQLNDSDAFIVFEYLLDEIGERVPIDQLEDVKDWDYWQATGIPEILDATSAEAPIELPEFQHSVDSPETAFPRVWYLPCQSLKEIAELQDKYAEDEREFSFWEFIELAESSYEDKLAMFVILIVNLW